MSPLKKLERSGRRVLVSLVGRLLSVHRRKVELGVSPRILVVRLDERVGNLVLSTPLLSSLRLRFPDAEIDLLASPVGRALLEGHAALSSIYGFRKKALLAPDGPVRSVVASRRRRYDLAIDATNPLDPSATQALVVRLCGARHTVGFDYPDFGRLFSAPVAVPAEPESETTMRLRVLTALPGEGRTEQTSLAPLSVLRNGSALAGFLGSLSPRPFVVLNLGARLVRKRLDAQSYAAIARAILERGRTLVLAAGPIERDLASLVAAMVPEALVAPACSLTELAVLLSRAERVVTCDTGPMHIAVAAGTPTCGIFVWTEPWRFGYNRAPHAAIDARSRALGEWLPELVAWIGQV